MAGFGRGGQRSSGSGGCGSSEDREIDLSTFTSAELIEYMRLHGLTPHGAGWTPPTTFVQAPISPPVIRHSTIPQSSAADHVQPELFSSLPIVEEQGGHAQVSQGPRPVLELTLDSTFKKSNKISSEITKIFRSYASTIEYRWTHLHSDEKERMFDALLSKFTLSPGCTKEDYHAPFTKLIKKRMNDIYYRARTDALAKCFESHDDYQAAKAFPPSWCTQERWNGLCDLFTTDAEFQKRSVAGKINRKKQKIHSTNESRSHNNLRAWLATQLCREPMMIEWWITSHTSKAEQTWSTPIAKDVLDKYTEKYEDDNIGKDSAVNKKLWKQVLKERNVGSSSRKQGLGGLNTYYSEESNIDSSVASTTHFGCPAQSSFALLDQDYLHSQFLEMANFNMFKNRAEHKSTNKEGNTCFGGSTCKTMFYIV